MDQELTDYERQREQRMAENAARLSSLGLQASVLELRRTCHDARAAGAAKPKARRQRDDAELAELQEAPRRRLRSAGPLPEEEQAAARRQDDGELEPLPVRRLAPTPRVVSEDAQDYDDYNTHRLQTMSDKSLLLRIKRIRNIAKLTSFIDVLMNHNRLELAQAAQQALAQLA